MEVTNDNYNEGASSSTSALVHKEDKKKNQPWIEKYRPQKFEEIMGKRENILILNFN